MARAARTILGSARAEKVASLAFVLLMFALVIFFALRVVPKAERPILGPAPRSTAPPSPASSATSQPASGTP